MDLDDLGHDWKLGIPRLGVSHSWECEHCSLILSLIYSLEQEPFRSYYTWKYPNSSRDNVIASYDQEELKLPTCNEAIMESALR